MICEQGGRGKSEWETRKDLLRVLRQKPGRVRRNTFLPVGCRDKAVTRRERGIRHSQMERGNEYYPRGGQKQRGVCVCLGGGGVSFQNKEITQKEDRVLDRYIKRQDKMIV